MNGLIQHLSIIFILFICPVFSSKENLYFDSQRKYQNVLIYIDKDVPEQNGKLLKSIKTHFSAASKSLFVATENMDENHSGVKFGNIYINVPNHWKVNATTTWQQSYNAIFKITAKSKNRILDKPYTKQIYECGKPGEYSRFPYSFFQKNPKAKKTDLLRKGKEIMVEFAKLRYGVFSEKPFKNILFVYNGTKLINGSCNQNIEWEVNDSPERCSDKNSNCKYKIKRNQKHKSSVMFDSETPSSESFCNDKNLPHNPYAYNLQNKICDGQSVTSVILKHPDFKDKSKTQIAYTNPEFHIVKQDGRKIVFVLDASGSMYKEMKAIKSALKIFIGKYIESSAEVGAVSFNHVASVVSPLITMDNENNQKTLIDKINGISCFGQTNIANGLQQGLEVLSDRNKMKNKDVASIILISDGESFGQNSSYYKNITKNLLEKEIVVNIILISKKSDSRLLKLSKKSGGNVFSLTKKSKILDIIKQFSRNQDKSKSKPERKRKTFRVTIDQSDVYEKEKRVKFTYKTKTIGENNVVTIQFRKDMSKYKVQLSDSKENFYDHKPVKNSKKVKERVFELPITVEGDFYLEITRKSKKHNKRTTESDSIPFSNYNNYQNDENRIIIPIGEISQKQIKNVIPHTAVTVTVDVSNCGITQFEKVYVLLDILSPTSRKTRILKDDGIGDDAVADDKIFTIKLFSKDFLETGYYSFFGKVYITNKITSEKIQRSVFFESLFVEKVSKEATIDQIPPAQMQEPIIRVVDNKKRTIELETIATGDDSMDGKIHKYQVLLSSTKEQIRNVTIEAEPYEIIKFTLDAGLDDPKGIFGISIRGVDDRNNVGKWSLLKYVKFST